MAFAGIFHPFARLRWIRFGLLMRDREILAPLFRSAIPAKYFAEWVKDAAGLERVMREVILMTKLDLANLQKGVCWKVTSELFVPSPVPSYLKIAPRSRCVRDRSSMIYQIVR
jgi:hypothetical protein